MNAKISIARGDLEEHRLSAPEYTLEDKGDRLVITVPKVGSHVGVKTIAERLNVDEDALIKCISKTELLWDRGYAFVAPREAERIMALSQLFRS